MIYLVKPSGFIKMAISNKNSNTITATLRYRKMGILNKLTINLQSAKTSLIPQLTSSITVMVVTALLINTTQYDIRSRQRTKVFVNLY